MELSARTKIDDLLSSYPFLLEFFLAKSPKYKLLQSPFTRKTLGKVASMGQVASIGGLEVDQLLLEVAAEVKEKTGEELTVARGAAEPPPAESEPPPAKTGPEAGQAAGAGEPGEAGAAPAAREGAAVRMTPEERQARQEILKGIIRDLHQGEDMEVLKQRFRDLITDIDASEIAAMEQGLIAEGMPESEIKRLCDVHVGVFQEALEAQPAPRVPQGHPVHTFMLENREAEKITRDISDLLAKAGAMGEEEFFKQYRTTLAGLLARLADINLHYLRKENQLFPILETYEITGPSQVMWALHDDIRDALRGASEELAAGKGHEAIITIRYATQSINDMVSKEESILFPMALETLSDSDWEKVGRGESEIGFAWITPEAARVPAEAAAPAARGAAGGQIELSTGSLTPEQVDLMLTHLPIEMSFVDENDEVRYFSQVKHKIFPRSRGVIGRKVQNCHPRSSLDRVQKILDEFRAGNQDVADFWIQMKDRFIYIRYFAVRDGEGNYKGTLEVVQDVTGIRGLTGQQRLLDWE